MSTWSGLNVDSSCHVLGRCKTYGGTNNENKREYNQEDSIDCHRYDAPFLFEGETSTVRLFVSQAAPVPMSNVKNVGEIFQNPSETEMFQNLSEPV